LEEVKQVNEMLDVPVVR